MTDIRNAVNAGLTVTTHEKVIQYKGWHGSGYIIIDPNTGTGAYLIDGGADGWRTQFIKNNAFIISLGLLALSFVPYVGSIANILGWV